MSRGKLISIVIGIALVVLLIAIFRSCRSGTVPPAEREVLDETSYRASSTHIDAAELLRA